MVTEYVEEVELVAIRNGDYTMYVFRKLKNSEYIMCTRLPNWQTPNVDIGDRGFLQFQIVKAGDNYYDLAREEHITYKYSNVYFINFVNSSDMIKKNKEIVL